jgi:hypothetical protein
MMYQHKEVLVHYQDQVLPFFLGSPIQKIHPNYFKYNTEIYLKKTIFQSDQKILNSYFSSQMINIISINFYFYNCFFKSPQFENASLYVILKYQL